MKFEMVRILFFSEFSVCCHPNFATMTSWQTTSPLYFKKRILDSTLAKFSDLLNWWGYYNEEWQACAGPDKTKGKVSLFALICKYLDN